MDFATIARASGIESTHVFDTIEDWDKNAGAILDRPGPVFVQLDVEARLSQATPKPARSMAEQIGRLREMLGVS